MPDRWATLYIFGQSYVCWPVLSGRIVSVCLKGVRDWYAYSQEHDKEWISEDLSEVIAKGDGHGVLHKGPNSSQHSPGDAHLPLLSTSWIRTQQYGLDKILYAFGCDFLFVMDGRQERWKCGKHHLCDSFSAISVYLLLTTLRLVYPGGDLYIHTSFSCPFLLGKRPDAL